MLRKDVLEANLKSTKDISQKAVIFLTNFSKRS